MALFVELFGSFISALLGSGECLPAIFFTKRGGGSHQPQNG